MLCTQQRFASFAPCCLVSQSPRLRGSSFHGLHLCVLKGGSTQLQKIFMQRGVRGHVRAQSSGGNSARAVSSVGARRSGTLPRSNLIEFSASLDTNLPLTQHPQATFDDYLAESERVFWAFFPEKDRCSKLGKHTWRIFMLPLEFWMLSVKPVVDMDIVLDTQPNKAKYPGARSVIHLNSVHWELKGVDYDPSEFQLLLAGALYADQTPLARARPSMAAMAASTSVRTRSIGASTATARSSTASASSYSSSSSSSAQSSTGRASSSAFASSSYSSSSSSSSSTAPYSRAVANAQGSPPAPSRPTTSASRSGVVSLQPARLRGNMTISVGCVAPGILAAIPGGTISSLGNAVLSRLLGAMKDKVNGRVLEDYKAFVLEKTGMRV